ncbi:hypothetical protein VPH35_115286 [Triticum aestivum]
MPKTICVPNTSLLKTGPQGLRQVSHLKSPTNPDARLAFLAGLGLSGADIASIVAKDPQLLCAKLERTLTPNVAGLAGLGLSHSQIGRLISYCHGNLHLTFIVSKLQYYLLLFGSIDNTLRALKRNFYLISSDLERVVKPNVAALRDSGLGDCDIAKVCLSNPRLLTTNVESIRTTVACAESLGVPRGSRMFRQALQAVTFLSVQKIAVRVEYLKTILRWSDAEVGIALTKSPGVLRHSNERLRRTSEFLISEVGLEPAYIAHRPALLTYSLEGRLRARYYHVKFLKANRFLERDFSYFSIVQKSEKVFMEKFICPHKEAAPHLADDYVDACRGQVPTRLRFA